MDNETMANDREFLSQLASHDSEIRSLGNRMEHVERGVNSLNQNMGKGFSDLSSKFERMNARPEFDFHKSVNTILALTILFSMVVGGIIYIVQQQNARTDQTVSSLHDDVDALKQKLGWVARVDKEGR